MTEHDSFLSFLISRKLKSGNKWIVKCERYEKKKSFMNESGPTLFQFPEN